ncbi:MAG: hypothetical protein AABX55_01995 [Nanoarchaeota archaeon]
MDIKQKLLALAIAIVLVMFIAVGIDTFYKAPLNPCDKIYEARPKVFISNCELLQEPNKTECFREQQLFYDNQSLEAQKCYNEFRPVENLYKRNVFIILAIIGVLTIVLGLFLKQVPAVYLGLMLGGLINIIEGVVRYWANMNEYLRFVILGILLAILIWISYKKLR